MRMSVLAGRVVSSDRARWDAHELPWHPHDLYRTSLAVVHDNMTFCFVSLVIFLATGPGLNEFMSGTLPRTEVRFRVLQTERFTCEA